VIQGKFLGPAKVHLLIWVKRFLVDPPIFVGELYYLNDVVSFNSALLRAGYQRGLVHLVVERRLGRDPHQLAAVDDEKSGLVHHLVPRIIRGASRTETAATTSPFSALGPSEQEAERVLMP